MFSKNKDRGDRMTGSQYLQSTSVLYISQVSLTSKNQILNSVTNTPSQTKLSVKNAKARFKS